MREKDMTPEEMREYFDKARARRQRQPGESKEEHEARLDRLYEEAIHSDEMGDVDILARK